MVGRRAYFIVWLVGLIVAASIAMAQSLPVPEAPLRLALKGYDPVAYFTEGKPAAGKAEYETVFDDTRYRFASARHLEQFEADPDRYAPQYAGWCAGAIADGYKYEADPENWLIVDGKLYVFARASVREVMRASPDEMIAKGRENWKTLVNTPNH